jgi:DNA polymerase eta
MCTGCWPLCLVFERGEMMAAGVAHTKLLAKLCSGLNKPNMQTVVPQSSVTALLHDLPIEKLRGLGGGFGQRVQAALGAHTVGAVLW